MARSGWRNVRILHADARTLSLATIRSALGNPHLQVDRVLCTLGLSVVPDWQKAFEATWELLAPGGRYAIMDWHLPRRTPFARIMNLIAASEVGRRWWEPLEQRAVEYEQESKFGGMVLVVSGRKQRS